jgi:hypothetical protein
METPRITISFDCTKHIHTDQMVEIYKCISSSKLFVEFFHSQFENVHVDGDMKEFFDAIDPTGVLYKNYEERMILEESINGASNDGNINS